MEVLRRRLEGWSEGTIGALRVRLASTDAGPSLFDEANVVKSRTVASLGGWRMLALLQRAGYEKNRKEQEEKERQERDERMERDEGLSKGSPEL